ncbi:MAG: hypothetical protein HPY79_01455 [Bacteroidales bacterium]|nr:hypothetical protein [Bacteroidales bacterium]
MYIVAGQIRFSNTPSPLISIWKQPSIYAFTNKILIKESFIEVIIYAQLPEKYQKNQSFLFENQNEIIFIIAHLHNRNELCQELSLPRQYHDSKIIFEAYKKWQEKGLKKCLGKWMFLTLNTTTKEISVARDHMGMFNYYYHFVNNSFSFSTNIELLKKISNSTFELNYLHLAGLAVGFNGTADETAYQNIFKVNPAHIIKFQNNQKQSQKYWDPPFNQVIQYKKEEDYIQHFLCLFRNIIKEHTNNNHIIASTLSSGLDSSFVTAITASELLKQNRNLIAITATVKNPKTQIKSTYRYADEAPFAQLVANQYPNIIHIIDKAEKTNPFEGLIKTIETHHLPVRNASNQYWLFSMFEQLAKQNVQTLLIGQMGNLTYSWPFFNPKPNQQPPWLQKLKNIFPFYQPFYIKNSYLNNSFIKQHRFLSYLNKLNYNPTFQSKNLILSRQYFFKQIHSTGYANWNEKANQYGINIIDPTADVRLIEFCFSLPNHVFINKLGNRMLIRKASLNILPSAIIQNPQKAIQSADVFERFLENYQSYENIILSSLKLDSIQQIFQTQKIINHINDKKFSTQVILRSLLISLFIYFATNKNDFRKKS